MSGSCHLEIGIVEIGVECPIFVIVIFFNCGRVLQFGEHSRVHQLKKKIVICTTSRPNFLVG